MKKAYVFDFDETLVKTDAKIHVYRRGAFHMSMDSKEFNAYVPKKGETLDFSDFNDPELILNARPYKMWPVIRNVSNAVKKEKSDSAIYILTARSAIVKSYIYEFLKNKGIDISLDHILAIGDDAGDVSISDEKRKRLKKLALRYDQVIFFDDDPKNIALAKSIKKVTVRLVESTTQFIEDSDPVHDMGIGMNVVIKDWVENETGYRYIKKDLLCICAKHGKTEFVKYLLDKGYDIHADDDKSLRWASENGHVEVVKLLLDAGADVHAGNDHALRLASTNGHTEVVKLLLDAGANIHANNDVAIYWAAKHGYVEIIKLFQDHIAKENQIVKESITHFREDSDPVHDMGIGMDAAIKDWIENETNYDYKEDYILWICAKYGETKFVKYLLKRGYDPNELAGAPLRAASTNGHIASVKLLLDAGANAHAKNDAALRWASEKGHVEVIKLLLDAGANVHANYDFPIRIASKNGHIKVVKTLIDAGADVHANNDAALRWASANGHAAVVKLLNKHKTKSIQEDMGGVGAPMSTPGNVPGMGSPMTAQPGGIGSGDAWTSNKKPYTQAANPPKTKKKKRKTEKDDSKIVSETLQHFREKVDPVKDMEVGKIEGLWDYTPEDAAIEVWTYMKPIVQRISSQAKKFNRGYLIVPKNITTNGCNALGFEPDPEIFNYMVHLVAKEIEKSIKEGAIPLSNSVRYIPPLNEENINPYDKLGMAMAKKMKVKPPFKKVKSKKNQNAMKQQKIK